MALKNISSKVKYFGLIKNMDIHVRIPLPKLLTKKKLKLHLISDLPDEPIINIISRTPFYIGIAFCLANKRLYQIYKNEELWRLLYERYFGKTDIYDLDKFTSFNELFKHCYHINKILAHPNFSQYSIKELYFTEELDLRPGKMVTYTYPSEFLHEICWLKKLKVLDLQENKITKISSNIGILINLEKLVLDKNNIK